MNRPHFPRRRVLKFGVMSLCAALVSPLRAQTAQPIRLALIESMSGPFANTGEAVFRNILWAVERVNARGGVKLPGGARPLQLDRYDSKGQNEEALSALRAAMDDGARIVMQGNSSATAAALLDAIDKNQRTRPGAARAAPQLFGGRSGANQRALQLLAFPL